MKSMGKAMRKKGKRQNFLLLSCYILLFCVACSLPAAHGKALPDTAKLVPAETVLLVNIDNFSRLEEQLKKTNFYKLYKDPAMATFIGDLQTKWRQEIQKQDNEFVRTIFDIDALPQGRVAVALVLDEQTKDADEPPFLFITQWGESITKIKEAADKMVKKAIEDGAHRKTEAYRGVNITTILQESGPKFNYCFYDDCLIGSTNPDILRFAIAHIKGATSATLSGDSDYTATMGNIGPYHDIDFYVNIKQIIKTALAEDSSGEAKSMVGNLGFDNVTTFGFSIGLARSAGKGSCGKAFVKINGPKKGILKMLDIESAVLRAPRFISASAYSLAFLNWNIRKAYNELYNILNGLSPQYAAIMHTPLLPPTPEGEPGVQLKRDIVDYLGSQIVIAQGTSHGSKGTGQGSQALPTETIAALAVNNSKALEKSLSLLHRKMIAPNKPEASRELLGHTIYLVSLPGLPFLMSPGLTPAQALAEPSVPQKLTLAFTITDTHLVFGTESTVERAIRTLASPTAPSVASAKWFTSARSAIPSVVGMAGLEDTAAASEILWQMIKESKTKAKDNERSISIGLNPGLVFSQMGLDVFNFRLLPEFDAVRKYFGLSASYGISRPDGFFFEFKYLNPAAGG